MTIGTYNRLNLHASASDVDVVRAARRKVHRRHRYGPAKRLERHAFYRLMIRYHHKWQRTVARMG